MSIPMAPAGLRQLGLNSVAAKPTHEIRRRSALTLRLKSLGRSRTSGGLFPGRLDLLCLLNGGNSSSWLELASACRGAWLGERVGSAR